VRTCPFAAKLENCGKCKAKQTWARLSKPASSLNLSARIIALLIQRHLVEIFSEVLQRDKNKTLRVDLSKTVARNENSFSNDSNEFSTVSCSIHHENSRIKPLGALQLPLKISIFGATRETLEHVCDIIL
jgi:hypothetical protein